MSKSRNHDAALKARVALEAVKGERTVSELTAEYGVHPTMIHQWKRSLLEGAASIFERGGKAAVVAEVAEETVWDLHAKIGELAVASSSLTHPEICPNIGEQLIKALENIPKLLRRRRRRASGNAGLYKQPRPCSIRGGASNLAFQRIQP